MYLHPHNDFYIEYNMKKIAIIPILALISLFPAVYIQAGLPQSVKDSTATVAPVPIDIIDINYEIERVERNFTKLENKLEPDGRFYEIDSVYKNYKIFLEEEAKSFKSYNPYNLSKYFLESTYRSWEGFSLKLGGWKSEINGRIKTVLDDIAELDKTIQTWDLTLKSEAFITEPEASKKRVREVVKQANDFRKELQKQKREYVLLEDDITDMTRILHEDH